MGYPEYLMLFENHGEYKVHVQFKDFDGKITNVTMGASEIVKLIDPSNGLFYEKLLFDDYLFEISKYEIDPIKKTFKINACKINKTTKGATPQLTTG